MQSTKRSKSTGLDIGQTSTKVICLARNGKTVSVKRAEIFRTHDEGILGDDENELLQAISGWLKELKLQEERMVIGLPQYMTTTQVSDFAKGAKGAELEKMVSLETTQLAGISDDSFIHDFAVIPAGNGRVNPVLIGISREASVNEYVGRTADASINLEDVAMNGLAVANAFMQLHPKEAHEPGVQLLLDMGTETTTVVVVSAGQVLYIGGMMFGGQNVTQEIATQLKLALPVAERQKIQGEVDWATLTMASMESARPAQVNAASDSFESADDRPAPVDQSLKLRLPNTFAAPVDIPEDNDAPAEKSISPLKLRLPNSLSGNSEQEMADRDTAQLFGNADTAFGNQYGTGAVDSLSGLEDAPAALQPDDFQPVPGLACFQTMLRELENCLEHWRSSENETLVDEKVKKIWLCGGGALLEQVSVYLSVKLDCDTDVFGPVVTPGGKPDPEYALAYGLALQGLGMSELTISLTPSALTWLHQKENRFRLLLIAFILLLLTSCGWLFYEYQNLVDSIVETEEVTEDLRQNVRKLKALDEMKKDYSGILLQVLPVVGSTCRSQTYLTALEQLQKAVKAPEFKDCINWCVYVADEDSFLEYNGKEETKADAPPPPMQMQPPAGNRRGRRQLIVEQPESSDGNTEERWKDIQEAEKKTTESMNVKQLKTLYVIGFIMSKVDNHNVIEREIMLNLEGASVPDPTGAPQKFFSDVQVMNEEERSKCINRAIRAWEQCFINMRTSEAFKSYDHKPFFLKLTINDPVITPPAQNPFGGPKKIKKKR